MDINTVFVGYNEEGIPMWETLESNHNYEPMFMGIVYDEENRPIEVWA